LTVITSSFHDRRINRFHWGDLHFPPSFFELLGLCSFQGPQATRLVDKLQELTPQVVPQNSIA
jgi:hypothetical protein